MKVKNTRNLFIILTLDLFLMLVSLYLAHLFRFDFVVPWHMVNNFMKVLPFFLAIKFLCFFAFDLYRGMWRYTSLNDLINIVKASTVSTVSFITLILYINRFHGISRSVLIIDWCLTIMLIMSFRILTRLCFEQFTENINFKDVADVFLRMVLPGNTKNNGRGVLIIGAGDYGEKVCREFRGNAAVKSHVAGFLDDDVHKIGRKIHGIPVLGEIGKIGEIVNENRIEDVIIAIPSVSAERMRSIVDLCKAADVNFKIIPDMGELIDGKIIINAIRNVEYKDLLGRRPVQLDRVEIGRYLGKKSVIVTGAAGSIGQGLCKQICRYSPGELILIERSESALYNLETSIKKNFPDIPVAPILADIQDRHDIERIFKLISPDIIFHAAAYKHVPMLEKFPWKAVENNIIGTKNLVELADQVKCEKFVFVSTDKAVNPCSVMGASKRICEIIVQNQSINKSSSTDFTAVRFGNVIGSDGSVIPLFKKQIKDGGPVTVTHPDMIRFFMLIPEACQLILQAGLMGSGGEIFILEMGEGINIDSMARDLIKFSGFKPDEDIKIVYTGLRPGEKLYEELMSEKENVIPTHHDKIMVVNNRKVDLNDLKDDIEALQRSAELKDSKQIRQAIKKIVPEYSPNI